jgi:hypothetical protein
MAWKGAASREAASRQVVFESLPPWGTSSRILHSPNQLFEYPKKSYLSSSYCQKYLPYFIHYFQYQTVLALRGIRQESPQSHVLHGIWGLGRVGECCGLHDGVT